LKVSTVFLVGFFAFSFVVNAGMITIHSSIANALQVIQRLFVTSDGTENGTPVMDVNTGGSVVVYGPLLDSNANPYIT